jgi:hypothetical protein
MEEQLKVNFQKTVSQLIGHDIGCQLLALADCSQLKKIANELLRKDLYHFPSLIKAAAQHLNLTSDPDKFVREHLEHLLWVHHREALWLSGGIRSSGEVGVKLHIKGTKHLKITANYPTVFISPMVLAYEDILWIIREITKKRELVIYGEGLIRDTAFSQVSSIFNLDGISIAGMGISSVRQILEVLNKNGILLTYPDFVYSGHKVQFCQLLGMKWPFSSSFIGICARDKTMLLPFCVRRECNDIFLSFEQPIQMILSKGSSADARWSRSLVGATVAQLLTKLIQRNPVQWLLLATVPAECEQRAK